MAVETLKLINGDTLMGDVIKVEGYDMIIIDPVEIQINENSKGQPVMLGLQWLPLTEDENEVIIDVTHVIARGPVSDEMMEMYFDTLEYLKHPDDFEKKRKERYEHYKKLFQSGVSFSSANTTNIH